MMPPLPCGVMYACADAPLKKKTQKHCNVKARSDQAIRLNCLVELSPVESVWSLLRSDSTRLNSTATDLVGFSFSRRVLNISESIAPSWVESSRIVWIWSRAYDWDWPILSHRLSYRSGTRSPGANRLNLKHVITFPTVYHTCKSMQPFRSRLTEVEIERRLLVAGLL